MTEPLFFSLQERGIYGTPGARAGDRTRLAAAEVEGIQLARLNAIDSRAIALAQAEVARRVRRIAEINEERRAAGLPSLSPDGGQR